MQRLEETAIMTKRFDSPDETRTFDKGRFDIVNIGSFKLGRGTFQPGWRWSISLKPVVNTMSCQVHHIGYVISGQMEGVLGDGTKFKVGPGDSFEVPPGHDAWVVGSSPVVYFEFLSAEEYAKEASDCSDTNIDAPEYCD